MIAADLYIHLSLYQLHISQFLKFCEGAIKVFAGRYYNSCSFFK
jgi:hypothetical protein